MHFYGKDDSLESMQPNEMSITFESAYICFPGSLPSQQAGWLLENVEFNVLERGYVGPPVSFVTFSSDRCI